MAKKSKNAAAPKFRDRIKRFDRVPASELHENPNNWRTHPESQKSALAGVLSQIGIAGACVARELDDGSLELIDGHLRCETMPETLVPVLVLDVSEAEAKVLLATMDPLAAMAEVDKVQLAELSRDIQISDQALAEMFSSLLEENDVLPNIDSESEQVADVQPVPTQFQLIVTCRDEADQKALYEALEKEGRDVRPLQM
jgi:hypothetical protein